MIICERKESIRKAKKLPELNENENTTYQESIIYRFSVFHSYPVQQDLQQRP